MPREKHEHLRLDGLVTHRVGNRIIVETRRGLFLCSTAKKDRYHRTTYGGVLVGDQVKIEISKEATDTLNPEAVKEAAIAAVQPRKNAFFRGNPATLSQPQGIAANITRIAVIGAIEERTTPFGLIDRMLVAAENCEDIERVVIWNKTDLLSTGMIFENTEFYAIYHSVGYRVVGMSTKRDSVEDLLLQFPDGRTLLIGASGVGKSTLLNRLLPALDLATNPISQTSGKGVHTTSAAHLYRLPNGAEVIDTPGFKSFILNGITSELEYDFPEFEPYLNQCQFADCHHIEDKGCAVRVAADSGGIAQSRYKSYVSMFAEAVIRR